jgi:hypothetical protein
VAGVHELLRQHSPEAFFQTSPEEDNQLLISAADVQLANAKIERLTTVDLTFFITFLWCC